jgi:hypothetical protein
MKLAYILLSLKVSSTGSMLKKGLLWGCEAELQEEILSSKFLSPFCCMLSEE